MVLKGENSMKRQYIKPDLSFESFEMSSNIATGCGTKVGPTEMSCDIDGSLGAGMGFFSENYSCEYTPDDAGMCYQKYSDEQKIFAS